MKVKNLRMIIVLGVLLLSSFSVFGSDSCKVYEVTDIESSGDLASMMGKHRIFDVDLMMKYDDDVLLPKGEIVLLESKFQRPKMLIGHVNSNGIREYTIDGKTVERTKLELRGIASEKKQIKICSN